MAATVATVMAMAVATVAAVTAVATAVATAVMAATAVIAESVTVAGWRPWRWRRRLQRAGEVGNNYNDTKRRGNLLL